LAQSAFVSLSRAGDPEASRISPILLNRDGKGAGLEKSLAEKSTFVSSGDERNKARAELILEIARVTRGPLDQNVSEP
jgi:hypothetical protein